VRKAARRAAHIAHRLAYAAGLFLLGACAGGGGSASLQGQPAQRQSNVALQVHIPATTTSSIARAPKFVSPSTGGIAISDYVHGSAIVAYSTSADLSVSSPSCVAVASGRNCAVSVSAPAGLADFTLTTYDVPPSNPNFGVASHVLGTASVTATIVAGTSNAVNVALGGVIAKVGLFASEPSVNGLSVGSVRLGVTALDSDGNIIIAGANTVVNGTSSQTDTYANPITVTLTENGGTGHASLSLNGGVAQPSVIVTKSSDVVALTYDGLGLAGYSPSLAAAAQGATGASAAVSPMFLLASGTGAYVAGAAPTLALSANSQSESVTVRESGFTTFSASANLGVATCPRGSIVVDTTSLRGDGTGFTISPGTTQTTGAGCVVTVADQLTTTIQILVTYVLSATIFLDNNTGAGFVDEYNPAASGNVAPQAILSGGNTGINQPGGLAFDPSGNLYIANINGNSITVYARGAAGGNATPTATIAGSNTGLSGPYAVFATSTKIYVSDETLPGSVRVFPIGSNGNVTPTQVITGSNTSLGNFNFGVAADSSGKIYVAEPFSNLILIFAANANGNARPIGTISGSNTGLSSPQGITIDSADNLYAGGATVNVYAPGATGNVAPIQLISGSNTGLNGVQFVAVDSNKNIYASNYGSACGSGCSITVYAAGATGNVAPIVTIAGSNTNITNPYGIAILPP
jgi:hypothetical protein